MENILDEETKKKVNAHLEELLNTMTKNFEEEYFKRIEPFIEQYPEVNLDNPENFPEICRDTTDRYKWVVKSALKKKGIPQDLDALYLDYDKMYRLFSFIFERYEGRACCGDKARTSLKRVYRHFMGLEDIQLSLFDYRGSKVFFRDLEDILKLYLVCKAVIQYGNIEPVLIFQAKIIANSENNNVADFIKEVYDKYLEIRDDEVMTEVEKEKLLEEESRKFDERRPRMDWDIVIGGQDENKE